MTGFLFLGRESVESKQVDIERVFQLGTWLGRKQALGLIAGRCTAAEMECLIEVYENKLYLAVEDSWEHYCRRRLGISRRTAERLIRNYRQQGPLVAKLNCFTRVVPREYRLFAAILTEEGLLFEGEVIPLEPDHAPRLAEAVDAVRQQAAAEMPTPDPTARAFSRAKRCLEAAVEEFSRLYTMELDETLRREFAIVVAQGRDQLASMQTPA